MAPVLSMDARTQAGAKGSDDFCLALLQDTVESMWASCPEQAQCTLRKGLDPRLRCLSSKRVPPMPLREYLRRISEHFDCSDACYAIASVYLRRIARQHKEIATRCALHRLLLISVILAAKYNDDRHFSNVWYAKVGGLACKDINLMEASFLQAIHWRVHVTSEEYHSCQESCDAKARNDDVASECSTAPSTPRNESFSDAEPNEVASAWRRPLVALS